MRFNEGGGWFKEENVVRIGSTGKDPQPLWHSFPPAVRDVSAAVARKKQEDGLTIEDVLAGKTSKEQAAWMQVQRLRETAGPNIFSQVRMQPLAARWFRHTWARLAAGSMVFFTVFLYPLIYCLSRAARDKRAEAFPGGDGQRRRHSASGDPANAGRRSIRCFELSQRPRTVPARRCEGAQKTSLRGVPTGGGGPRNCRAGTSGEMSPLNLLIL